MRKILILLLSSVFALTIGAPAFASYELNPFTKELDKTVQGENATTTSMYVNTTLGLNGTYISDWSDISGGGGGSASIGWSWNGINLLRMTTTTDDLLLGATSTSTDAKLEVQGDTYINGNSTTTGSVIGNNLNISNWDTAYGWGDHALGGYLLQSDWEATTTDALAEGSTNYYYTDTRFDSSYNATTTLNGFTNNSTDWDTAFGWGDHSVAGYLLQSEWETTTTDALAEGSTNFYYTEGRFDTSFSGKSTTDLTEGTNLYYTDARVSDYISASTTLPAYFNYWTLTGSELSYNGFTTDGGAATSTDSYTANGTSDEFHFTNATGTELYINGDATIDSMNGMDATYSSVNDWWNLSMSAGRATGGAITAGGGTTVDVAAGTGFIRIADDDISQVKFIDWNASSTIDIATNSILYFGVRYNGGSPEIYSTLTEDWDLDTEFPLGHAINQGDEIYILSNPWWVSDGLTNMIEKSEGIAGHLARDKEVGGLILGYAATSSPTMTAGTLWGRTNEFELAAFNEGETFDYYYRNAGGATWTENSDETKWSVLLYDDNSGTLQNIPSNKYAVIWVWVNVASDKIALTYPQATYSTSAAAENEEIPSTFPSIWYKGGIIIGRIIIQQGIDGPVQVQSVFTTTFTAAQASDHGNLAGLTDDDHPQYGALAQAESVTALWDFSAGLTANSATTTDSVYVGGFLDLTGSLTSYWGAACSAGDYVSDIADDGTLTCGTPAGGGAFATSTSDFWLSTKTLGEIGDVSTTTLAYGGLLSWDGSNWNDTATSTLAINTDNLIEGSNLFYTQARGWADTWASSTLATILTNSQTAYDWGDHALVGYLLQSEWETTTTDALAEGSTNYYYTETRFDASYNATTTLSGFTDNSTNWDTAFGWGDWNGNIDISTDTNLVDGTNITLDDDTLNVDDAFLLLAGDSSAGDYIFTGTSDYSGGWLSATSSLDYWLNASTTRPTTSYVWDFSDNTNATGGTNITLNGDAIDVDDAFLVNDADDITTGGVSMNSATTTDTAYIGGDLSVIADALVTGDVYSTNSSSTATSTAGLFRLPNGYCMFEDNSTTTPNMSFGVCPDE